MSRHAEGRTSPWELSIGPPPERWDDWVELDAAAWPERIERRYRCIPTTCFNCEAACGLLAFVDQETDEIVKFEGNPLHPGSRGRTCAKGPATINQVRDPERILTPLKRSGPRGSGSFREASWEEALEDIGSRIRRALDEERHDEVVYHVGRPGDDHFVNRMLQAWGVDGHDSHTNVCSASARLGYALWCGGDRPSPDYAETRFMLLLSAHLETGHYFNPHAQRIMEAKERGARLAVIDPRLSNTASHADLWISPWPGTESALLLGVARELLRTERFDAAFVRRWVNWEESLAAMAPEAAAAGSPGGAAGQASGAARAGRAEAGGDAEFERFLDALRAHVERFTPEVVAEECRIEADVVLRLSEEIAAAGSRFSSHLWRGAAAGHLHGWQVARCLVLLHALTGSWGTRGGVSPASWDKHAAKPPENPPPVERWNEVIWPREYPLSHYEMSFLLPHLLRRQDRRIDTYFTRVYNPVWTNPDGCSWIEMLEDEERVGCHVALTPIWSETAQWADWVLPMGVASERHDVMSQETHSGSWVALRQPVGREARRRRGEAVDGTLGTNPGQVWEESEFWIELTWRIDPDGSRGIRRWYESKERPGERVGLDEYWGGVLAGVPGLAEKAREDALDPLSWMRRHGAVAVPHAGQERHEREAAADAPGVDVEGRRLEGFPTPSRKLELWSPTLAEWGFAEHALPAHVPSQVHWRDVDLDAGQRVLLPTFRLPTLIHTRSGNAKWLQEISHSNPVWVHPSDAEALGLEQRGLVRVTTRIGWFVGRVWCTESIRPSVVACSHHVGRWRMHREVGGARISSSLVDFEREGTRFRIRCREGALAWESDDPDTARAWWKEIGVHQNLAFPVQPDPVSGMHCWHQLVTVSPAHAGDRHGDVVVDTEASRAVFEEWLEMTRPGPGPGGLRRPKWLGRPLRPADSAWTVPEA